jgi:hypothetical protein
LLTKELYLKYRSRKLTDKQISRAVDVNLSKLRRLKIEWGITLGLKIPPDLKEKADALGLHQDTIRYRMKHMEMTLEEACTTPNMKKRISYELLQEAKEKHGIHPSTVYRRMDRGYSLEDALKPNIYNAKKKEKAANFLEIVKASDIQQLLKWYPPGEESAEEWIKTVSGYEYERFEKRAAH